MTGLLTAEIAFQNCSNLATLPVGLFRFNTGITTFNQCFITCPKIQLNTQIFCLSGETTTRFLNQSPNFNSCFNRASFTGTQGTAPDLWNYSYGTGTPTTTNCFAGAGNSLTSLTNYASIPTAWKT